MEQIQATGARLLSSIPKSIFEEPSRELYRIERGGNTTNAVGVRLTGYQE